MLLKAKSSNGLTTIGSQSCNPELRHREVLISKETLISHLSNSCFTEHPRITDIAMFIMLSRNVVEYYPQGITATKFIRSPVPAFKTPTNAHKKACWLLAFPQRKAR